MSYVKVKVKKKSNNCKGLLIKGYHVGLDRSKKMGVKREEKRICYSRS